MSGQEDGLSVGDAVSRRTALKTIGGSIAALGTAGTGRAADDWVTVTDYGIDNTGSEPISNDLEDVPFDDGDTLHFPAGDYLMDDWFRHTGFEDFSLRGDDATVRPTAGFEGQVLFKLGVPDAPGGTVFVEGFDFDFTREHTGVRALQVQVTDRLDVWDVDVVGYHDSGKMGPFLFDVVDAGGNGAVRNVNAPEGGAYSVNTPGDIWVGPTGIIVSSYHRGTLTFENVSLGPFPDNGLYCSTETGRVVVEDSYFENSNVANIRLSGDHSEVHNCTVVVDENRPEDVNQRAIRLDGGSYNWVEDTTVYLDEPNGRAISFMPDVEWGRVQNSRVVVRGDDPVQAVVADAESGRVDLLDTDIQFDTPGQAIQVNGPSSGDADQAYILRTSVTGGGDGSAGRHAVRLERGNCTVDRLSVDQTGGDYRRALKVLGDDCWITWGTYSTDHIPVVDEGDDNRYEGITARSKRGYPSLKANYGSRGVEVVESTIYNGVRNFGDEAAFVDNVYR